MSLGAGLSEQYSSVQKFYTDFADKGSGLIVDDVEIEESEFSRETTKTSKAECGFLSGRYAYKIRVKEEGSTETKCITVRGRINWKGESDDIDGFKKAFAALTIEDREQILSLNLSEESSAAYFQTKTFSYVDNKKRKQGYVCEAEGRKKRHRVDFQNSENKQTVDSVGHKTCSTVNNSVRTFFRKAGKTDCSLQVSPLETPSKAMRYGDIDSFRREKLLELAASAQRPKLSGQKAQDSLKTCGIRNR
jgi:hypothetical protein